jgi:hypothetical protein
MFWNPNHTEIDSMENQYANFDARIMHQIKGKGDLPNPLQNRVIKKSLHQETSRNQHKAKG